MVADGRQAISDPEPDIAEMNPAAKRAAAQYEQRGKQREPARSASHR
jgi:hypothetical protein